MYPEIITEYTDDLSNHFREWAKTEDLDPDKFCTILSYELSKRVFPKWIQDSSNFLLEEESQNIENHQLIDGLKLSGFFLKKFLFIDDFDKSKQQNSLYRNNIISGLKA